MKTITIASCKGGSAKTTSVVTLAWRAAQDLGRVGMIDLNSSQGTLTQWWNARGRTVNPYLMEGTDLEDDLRVLRETGFQLCLIDTPPANMDLIEVAVVLSDAVIIPVMCSYFDTSAVDAVVDMCRRRNKPYRFLLSAYDKREAFASVTTDTFAALMGRGETFMSRLSYDAGYRIGQLDGKAGPEKSKKLKDEVDALWGEVCALVKIEVPPRLAVVKGGRRG